MCGSPVRIIIVLLFLTTYTPTHTFLFCHLSTGQQLRPRMAQDVCSSAQAHHCTCPHQTTATADTTAADTTTILPLLLSQWQQQQQPCPIATPPPAGTRTCTHPQETCQAHSSRRSSQERQEASCQPPLHQLLQVSVSAHYSKSVHCCCLHSLALHESSARSNLQTHLLTSQAPSLVPFMPRLLTCTGRACARTVRVGCPACVCTRLRVWQCALSGSSRVLVRLGTSARCNTRWVIGGGCEHEWGPASVIEEKESA